MSVLRGNKSYYKNTGNADELKAVSSPKCYKTAFYENTVHL